jgi:hypothetical protein
MAHKGDPCRKLSTSSRVAWPETVSTPTIQSICSALRTAMAGRRLADAPFAFATSRLRDPVNESASASSSLGNAVLSGLRLQDITRLRSTLHGPQRGFLVHSMKRGPPPSQIAQYQHLGSRYTGGFPEDIVTKPWREAVKEVPMEPGKASGLDPVQLQDSK